ncbi:RNA polymerase sigma factor, sigma-70 family [Novosphingobium sp. AP12]|nr:RNA polymerase sigma factor, sigma-70 family [Novosphingobium sp. AP12]
MPEHDSVEETNALRTLLAKEKLRRVSAILMTMPERTRSVFILSRLEGLRYAEIATRYAISVSAVQKHMLRAIETLMQAGEDDA